MSLPLPPPRLIRCDAATAQFVHDQLTSVIAGHPQATTTYRFYEEIDQWLGPWGASGYPIGYGKFYNVAFTTNAHLMANPTTREWVWRTGIRLQELLRDYLVRCVRHCTLPSLTEAQLRQAAFDSHPQAYDEGGLAMVVLVAPELVPIIATIPGREFSPTSDNFGPTVKQVFITLGRIGPTTTGNALAALAGPAHTGILGRAVQRDQQRLQRELALSRELAGIREAIERGALDHIPLLDQVIARLNATEFPDAGFARLAAEVIQAAERRKQFLRNHYRRLLPQSPEVQRRVERAFPQLLR